MYNKTKSFKLINFCFSHGGGETEQEAAQTELCHRYRGKDVFNASNHLKM